MISLSCPIGSVDVLPSTLTAKQTNLTLMPPTAKNSLVWGIIILGILLAAAPLPANDRLEGWKRLGEKLVDHKVERDEINVGADEGVFNRIKLEVKNADVEFLNVKVVYANGADQDIEVRLKIKAGGETRPIDLDGHRRIIKKVVLLYKTERDERHRALVVLYGHR